MCVQELREIDNTDNTNITPDNLSKEFKDVLDILENTKHELSINQAIFITGSAGTGKSTLISYIKQDAFFSNAIYLGSTGISAYNIEGKTIHSLFGINPFASDFGALIYGSLGKLKHDKIIDNETILVIDEISMVSNLILDTISYILQRFLKNDKPLGGLKTVFVGDFLQLPPVFKKGDCYVKDIKEYMRLREESYSKLKKLEETSPDKLVMSESLASDVETLEGKLKMLPHEYVGSCFDCITWKQLNPKIIHLRTIHRFQNSNEYQREFINHLLQLRKGIYDINYWKQFHKSSNNNNDKDEKIQLTSLNAEAEQINSEHLKKLPGNT